MVATRSAPGEPAEYPDVRLRPDTEHSEGFAILRLISAGSTPVYPICGPGPAPTHRTRLAYHRVVSDARTPPTVAALAETPSNAPTRSRPSLTENGLRFLQTAGRYAVISTIDADGGPHQAVIWYRLEGQMVVVNSAEGRRWPTNLARDPRVSLTVSEGYDWVSVTGTVEAIHEQAIAQADIAAMAVAYDEPDDAAKSIARFRTQHRISFHIQPTRIHEEFED